MSDLENQTRHVIGVEETPDSVIIEYAKIHDDEEVEMEMDMEENAHYGEDEEEDERAIQRFFIDPSAFAKTTKRKRGSTSLSSARNPFCASLVTK